MTDNNANDPLPDDENLGSAGSPHSTGRSLHQRSNDLGHHKQEYPSSHCENCGVSIPPTHTHCPDHQRESGPSNPSSEWSISNLGMVVVSASGELSALAKASVALRRRDNSVGSEESFDLLYDLGELSDTISSQWEGDLRNTTAVEFHSPLGTKLCKQAVSKAGTNSQETDTIGDLQIDPTIISSTPNSKSYLYTERGEAITDQNQLSSFRSSLESKNDKYWVVPALLYTRSDTETNKPTQVQNCVNCGTSEHIFDGTQSSPSDTEKGEIGIWECTECNSKKAGNIPKSDQRESRSSDADENIADIDRGNGTRTDGGTAPDITEKFVDNRDVDDSSTEITIRQTPLYDRGHWERYSMHQHHIWFLDLFSGPGGVGHAVKQLLPFNHMWAGVDIEDYSEKYPGEFIQANLLNNCAPFNGLAADVCWVSFPCTAYSSLSPTAYGSREAALESNPRLTDEGIRKLARDNGAHYIIENVPGATRSGDLEPNVRLNGLAFGKPYDCERHFETSFPCPNAYEPGKPEIAIETREDQGEATRKLADAKGVPPSWSRQEIRSAIPQEFVFWLLHHCPTDAISAPKPDRAQQTLDAAVTQGESA